MVNSYPDLRSIPLPTPPPPVIFLDAVGTLFGVREGVGTIYQRFAARYGLDCGAEAIEREFYLAFKAADATVFAGATPEAIPLLEYRWWREINQNTFRQLGVLDRFDQFENFFRELYPYFATAPAWELYEDTIPTLQRWRDAGCTLGVLSNFDTRLYDVLDALGLDGFFTSVTISTTTGAAKPDGAIFHHALTQHGLPASAAHQAWHIGDSFAEDYQGAQAAGLQAWWLQRK